MKLEFIFILILFSVSCENKFIKLQLEIYNSKYFNFPLEINDKKLDTSFYALESNSDYNLIVAKSSYCNSETTKNRCYIPDSNKEQKKNQNFSLYTHNITNKPLYKDKIKINNISIGDWEIIYFKERETEDYDAIFNFNSKTLTKLKKNKIIDKEIITYEKPKNNSITVYIGKDYSTSDFKKYSKSKMENGLYGCKMNKISVANSITDFKDNKDVKSKSFSNINVEFYVLEGQDDVIYGPNKTINEISKFLNESGFKCDKPFEGDVYSVNCKSNKNGFLYFGDSIIGFNNITFLCNNKLNHLYFTLNAIKDLNTIIDVNDKKIVFYSQNENVVLSSSTSAGTYAFYIFIIIIVCTLIGGVFYFFIYAPKKYPTGTTIEINKKYALL